MNSSAIFRILWDRDLILAAVALLLCLLFLWSYLRSVRRSMLDTSRAAVPLDADTPAMPEVPPAARLEIVSADTPSNAAVRAARRGLVRSAAVQLAAGVAYALTVTAAWVWVAKQIAPDQQVMWQGIVLFAVFFAWPVVIVVGLIAMTSWRAMTLLVAAYAIVLASMLAYQMQGTPVTPALIASGWWQVNGYATLFVLVFVARPIRAMGPIVAALTVAGWLGLLMMAHVLTPQSIKAIATVAEDLDLTKFVPAAVISFVVYASPAIAAVLVGYFSLRLLGRLHRARWISDQTIQADAVWLTFAVLQAPPQIPWLGVVAFPVYKLVAWLGQRLVSQENPNDLRAPRLLLLRVFSLGARSGRLFESFSKVWRHQGTIRLIAGPDLANTTVEPHEFLDFLAGRLHRRFISSRETLDRRLAEAEPKRDPDGLFRVASFYCHDDTWRSVLRRLAQESDLVLMDLRGFTGANSGCVFELHELLETVATDRILLVIDASTDEAFLAAVLSEGWARIRINSPNRDLTNPTLRLYRLDAPGNASVSRLAATLATQFSAVGST